MTVPDPATPHWRRPLRQVNHERAPWIYHLIARFAQTVVPMVARRRWVGMENVPKEGPVIVVANHISNFDPIVMGEFLIWSGRWPRFLGKADIWKVPVLGWIARQADQIPVHRGTTRAADSLVHAHEALKRGKLVAIYPEGTITGDPDVWPMSGRRGAARLALDSGAPVIPVAQTGAHLILGQKSLEFRKLFGRRRDVAVMAGPPIDLTPFRGRARNPALLDEVTDLFLDVITGMVAELRGEQPPEGRYDIRKGMRVPREPRADQ